MVKLKVLILVRMYIVYLTRGLFLTSGVFTRKTTWRKEIKDISYQLTRARKPECIFAGGCPGVTLSPRHWNKNNVQLGVELGIYN